MSQEFINGSKPEETNERPTVYAQFQDELDTFDQALKELDDLYDEVKKHYDGIKSARAKGTLVFLQAQTSNLIQLKNAKIAVLKEKASIRKTSMDMELKYKREEGGGDTDHDAIVRSVLSTINSNPENTISTTDGLYDQIEEDGDIEAKIEAEIARRNITFNSNEIPEEIRDNMSGLIEADEEEEEEDEDDDVTIYVVVQGKKWNYMAFDSEMKRVKGYPVPDKTTNKVKVKKNGDKYRAIDENGIIYPVIKK